MRWFERFRMAMLMLFRRKTQNARLNDELRSTSTSRSRRTSLAAWLQTRRDTQLCARSAILRRCAMKRDPVGAGIGWRSFCATCATVRAPSRARRVSRSPRFWLWRSASAPPLHYLPSCARYCSSRCPSATRTSWSWSMSTFARTTAETGFNVVSPADFNDWRQQTHGFEDMAAWLTTDFDLTGEHAELPEVVQGCGRLLEPVLRPGRTAGDGPRLQAGGRPGWSQPCGYAHVEPLPKALRGRPFCHRQANKTG